MNLQDTALPPVQPVIHNKWSQLILYAAILRDGRATAPCEQTNTARDKASRLYRKLLAYLVTTLLLAGDVQLNPGLVSAQDLQPPAGTPANPGQVPACSQPTRHTVFSMQFSPNPHQLLCPTPIDVPQVHAPIHSVPPLTTIHTVPDLDLIFTPTPHPFR